MNDPKEEVSGEVGFDKDKPSKPKKEDSLLTREESLFMVDEDGKAIPQKYPIEIYDRQLDQELVEESTLLLVSIKKKEAINKVINKLKAEVDNDINKLNEDLKKEDDKDKKKLIHKEIDYHKGSKMKDEVDSRINAEMLEESIKESRQFLAELNKIRESTKKILNVELAPCNSSESHFAFKKGKTVEGKDTDDWVADLISKKVSNPKYTLDDAKNLKIDYKIPLKEAIMEASGYRQQSYREIMAMKQLEETKPLTAKKKD